MILIDGNCFFGILREVVIGLNGREGKFVSIKCFWNADLHHLCLFKVIFVLFVWYSTILFATIWGICFFSIQFQVANLRS